MSKRKKPMKKPKPAGLMVAPPAGNQGRVIAQSPTEKPTEVTIFITNPNPSQLVFGIPVVDDLITNVRNTDKDIAIKVLLVNPAKPALSEALTKQVSTKINAEQVTVESLSLQQAQILLQPSNLQAMANRGAKLAVINHVTAMQAMMKNGMHVVDGLRGAMQIPLAGGQLADFFEFPLGQSETVPDTVVLCPTEGVMLDPGLTQTKAWPVDRWHELINRLVTAGKKVVILQNEGEEVILPDGVVDGVTTVVSDDLTVLLTELKKAERVYAIDNYLAVLATSLGIPVTQIYSGTPCSWTALVNDRNTVVTSIIVGDITVDDVI